MDAEIRKILAGNGVFSKRSIMVRSFFGGVAWGVGSVIGATLLIALLLAILSTLNNIPFLGNIATSISQTINQSVTRPQTGP